MDKNYELARIENSISKIYHAINFHNGRGEAGLGFFHYSRRSRTIMRRVGIAGLPYPPAL